MEKKLIEEQIKDIISNRLEIDLKLIKLESKLKDELGIDSFGLVEMSFEIKDKFGIALQDQDFQSIVTVKDAVAFISARLKEK